jgi:hypothetical protein
MSASGGYGTTFQPLLPGLAGTAETLWQGQGQVEECMLDPSQKTRRATTAVLNDSGITKGNKYQQARCIFDYLVATVNFVPNPSAMQLLVHPLTHLESIENQGYSSGACNDFAFMTAAMGHVIRVPIVLIICSVDGAFTRDDYEHIYPAMVMNEDADPTDESNLLAMDSGSRTPIYGIHSNLKGVKRTHRKVVPALRVDESQPVMSSVDTFFRRWRGVA